MIYVRCNSHRARERALSLLNDPDRQTYYSSLLVNRDTGRGVFQVTKAELAIVRTVKGVTRLRGPYDDLRQCWTF